MMLSVCWLPACRMDRHFYARIVCSQSLASALRTSLRVCRAVLLHNTHRLTHTHTHPQNDFETFQLHVNAATCV